MTDLALAQLPDECRHGTPVLASADGAGATKEWLTYLRAQRRRGIDLRFSVGFTMTEAVQQAILALPEAAWSPAIESDGELRAGADVAELTRLLTQPAAAGGPVGMRVIVRRERPHPGAQLRFTDADGRLPDLRHRHPRLPAGAAGGSAPGACPGRGPDSLGQGHRVEPPAVPRLRDQRRLAGTDPAGV